MHGGSHSRNNGCGPGMMYQNGGCVPASGGMRRGGRTRRRFEHGGHTHSHYHQLIPDINAIYTLNNVDTNSNAGHTHSPHSVSNNVRQRNTRRMMHGGRHNGASDHHRKSAKRDSRGRK